MPAALALVLLAPAAEAQQEGISASAMRQIGALLAEKASRTPAQQNISSSLLLEIKRQRDDPSLVGLPKTRSEVTIDAAGRVLVDITAAVDKALLARIETLGGRVVSHFERYDAVRAELPLDRIEALAAWPELRSIRPADAFMTQQGTVVTEGDVAHLANQARANQGIDGTGVAVGAMSDSVDELGDIQADNELPAVTVLAGQDGIPGTSEGTALLEIIHDMAPGAELFFATGSGGMAQMATNIQDLAAAGCDVIVDDVIYFAEGVFQDDIIAQAVEAVAAQGVLYFSAAGNSGNLRSSTSGVYEGDYSGAALPPVLAGAGVSAHDFGGSTVNTITEPGFGTGNDARFFTLQWSDPLGGSGNDYDLFLLDEPGNNVLAASLDIQNGNDFPFEDINSQGLDDTDNNLVVVKVSGSDRHIHLNTHRAELLFATDGQIFGHPAAENAIAVAAVNAAAAGGAGGVFDGSESVATYSSDGPRRIFFEADGSPVPAVATPDRGISQASIVRDKPDVAAADGVSVTSMNFQPWFFGTSASAPHAAAIAALFEELFNDRLADVLGGGAPGLTVPQMRDLFRSNALDIQAPGFDRDSGVGLVLTTEDPQSIFADGFESGDTSSWTSQTP